MLRRLLRAVTARRALGVVKERIVDSISSGRSIKVRRCVVVVVGLLMVGLQFGELEVKRGVV